MTVMDLTNSSTEKELLNAGIVDLGGVGDYLLEIEYIDVNDKHIEGFYRCSLDDPDILRGKVLHTVGYSAGYQTLSFEQTYLREIWLPNCKRILEVRMPPAMGGEDITKFISCNLGWE